MSTNTKPLEGQIALVTGASRGIGRASALALAAAGAHIIATARTQGGLEELDDEILRLTGSHATLVPLDLAEPDGLDHLGLAIHKRFGHLDLLVHCGAILGPITPVSHIDLKAWDNVMAINATATFRLIRSTEPLLKAAAKGRALFLTSGRVVRPKAFWGPYGTSKAAMEHIVRTWADEMENTSVRAALVDPNQMRTKMRAEAMPGEDPMTVPDPSEIGPLIVELAQAELGLPTTSVLFSDWKLASASPASA